MEYIIIPLVGLGSSLLTFFSGFGLGTILTPVFALFFPLHVAIPMTAVVHFFNGIFKFSLVRKHLQMKVFYKFGIPAIFAASLGAWIMLTFTKLSPIYSYYFFGKNINIHPINLLIGILILLFTLFELLPSLRNLKIDKRYLILGGICSGFFGGLSGHQGALRSAFLAKADLTKEQFIATGSFISMMIDFSRLIIYSQILLSDAVLGNSKIIMITTSAAFLGAYLGNNFLKKISMEGLQKIVSISLVLLSILLCFGII